MRRQWFLTGTSGSVALRLAGERVRVAPVSCPLYIGACIWAICIAIFFGSIWPTLAL